MLLLILSSEIIIISPSSSESIIKFIQILCYIISSLCYIISSSIKGFKVSQCAKLCRDCTRERIELQFKNG